MKLEFPELARFFRAYAFRSSQLRSHPTAYEHPGPKSRYVPYVWRARPIQRHPGIIMPRPDAFHAFSRAPFGAMPMAAAGAAVLHVSSFLCIPWTEALIANLSLSYQLALFLSFSLLLSFLTLSLSLGERRFYCISPNRYHEENSLFSPTTEEIPLCTSIAGIVGRWGD